MLSIILTERVTSSVLAYPLSTSRSSANSDCPVSTSEVACSQGHLRHRLQTSFLVKSSVASYDQSRSEKQVSAYSSAPAPERAISNDPCDCGSYLNSCGARSLCLWYRLSPHALSPAGAHSRRSPRPQAKPLQFCSVRTVLQTACYWDQRTSCSHDPLQLRCCQPWCSHGHHAARCHSLYCFSEFARLWTRLPSISCCLAGQTKSSVLMQSCASHASLRSQPCRHLSRARL